MGYGIDISEALKMFGRMSFIQIFNRSKKIISSFR